MCIHAQNTRRFFLVKNIYLDSLLTEIGHNNDAIWTSIITNKGSVQHLPILNEGQKAIFKTAQELDQNWVIEHAANRQKYICQGQSVNVFFPSGADKGYVNSVHLNAWLKGLKGLYYLRTEAKNRAENVSEKVERVALSGDMRSIVYSKPGCPFCTLAEEELKLRGISFDKICLKEIEKTAAEVTGRNVKTVPQIYIAGEYVGGYDDLMVHLTADLETATMSIDEDDDECTSCHG